MKLFIPNRKFKKKENRYIKLDLESKNQEQKIEDDVVPHYSNKEFLKLVNTVHTKIEQNETKKEMKDEPDDPNEGIMKVTI